MRPLTAEDPIAPGVGRRPRHGRAGLRSPTPSSACACWPGRAAQTRVLEPAQAEIDARRALVATVELKTGQPLRAAELVEVYRRHGNWKVRAVASGWIGGVEAASAAVGVPRGAFQPLRAAAPSPRRPTPRPASSASTVAGPAVLRAADRRDRRPRRAHRRRRLPRVQARRDLRRERRARRRQRRAQLGHRDPAARLRRPSDARMAEAAARTSGEAPMGRIAFDGGHVYASVSTVVDQHGARHRGASRRCWPRPGRRRCDFARRSAAPGAACSCPTRRRASCGSASWRSWASRTRWTEIREMLVANNFMLLVDAPQTCLAPADGTLWLGPVRLAGAARAWSVLCERVLRADVELSPAAWREIADWNTVSGPMRLGVVQEVGVDAEAVVVLNFNALQVQRGQPRRDLEVGLGHGRRPRERDGAGHARELIAGTTHRNNLPWFPTRRWSGPPRELADDILARELVGPPGRRAAAARLRRPRARPLRRARPRRRGLPRPPRAAARRAPRRPAAAVAEPRERARRPRPGRRWVRTAPRRPRSTCAAAACSSCSPRVRARRPRRRHRPVRRPSARKRRWFGG